MSGKTCRNRGTDRTASIIECTEFLERGTGTGMFGISMLIDVLNTVKTSGKASRLTECDLPLPMYIFLLILFDYFSMLLLFFLRYLNLFLFTQQFYFCLNRNTFTIRIKLCYVTLLFSKLQLPKFIHAGKCIM